MKSAHLDTIRHAFNMLHVDCFDCPACFAHRTLRHVPRSLGQYEWQELDHKKGCVIAEASALLTKGVSR